MITTHLDTQCNSTRHSKHSFCTLNRVNNKGGMKHLILFCDASILLCLQGRYLNVYLYLLANQQFAIELKHNQLKLSVTLMRHFAMTNGISFVVGSLQIPIKSSHQNTSGYLQHKLEKITKTKNNIAALLDPGRWTHPDIPSPQML